MTKKSSKHRFNRKEQTQGTKPKISLWADQWQPKSIFHHSTKHSIKYTSKIRCHQLSQNWDQTSWVNLWLTLVPPRNQKSFSKVIILLNSPDLLKTSTQQINLKNHILNKKIIKFCKNGATKITIKRHRSCLKMNWFVVCNSNKSHHSRAVTFKD